MKDDKIKLLDAQNKIDEAVIRADAIFATLELIIESKKDDDPVLEGLMYQLTDIRELVTSAAEDIEQVRKPTGDISNIA